MGGLVLFLWLGLEVMRRDVGLWLDCDELSVCVWKCGARRENEYGLKLSF